MNIDFLDQMQLFNEWLKSELDRTKVEGLDSFDAKSYAAKCDSLIASGVRTKLRGIRILSNEQVNLVNKLLENSINTTVENLESINNNLPLIAETILLINSIVPEDARALLSTMSQYF